MGLFDAITNVVKGQASGADGQNGLLDGIMSMVGQQSGGLGGLLQQFNDKGLGDVVSSWVGSGQNQEISASQIQEALGSEQIQELAGKLGLSSEQAAGGVAQALPQIIDKLTPDGNLPADDLLQQGLSLLKGKFFS